MSRQIARAFFEPLVVRRPRRFRDPRVEERRADGVPHGLPLFPRRAVILGVFLKEGRELMAVLVVALVVDEEFRKPEIFAPPRAELLCEIGLRVKELLEGDQGELREGVLADDVPFRRLSDALAR